MTIANLIALLALLGAMAVALATMWWRLNAKMSAAVAELHQRLNRTRDEYVRRDDLAGHLIRIEDGQKEISAGLSSINLRIDNFVLHMAAPAAAVRTKP